MSHILSFAWLSTLGKMEEIGWVQNFDIFSQFSALQEK
jgi:hypothetical protein